MLGKSRTPEMLLQTSFRRRLMSKSAIRKCASIVCYVDAFVYGKSRETIRTSYSTYIFWKNHDFVISIYNISRFNYVN